ncbi:unnamed protein product, partial [Pelagomonas calceolata]
MARATFTRKTRPKSSEPSMLYNASAASFSSSKVTKAKPRFASFVWPAKSLGMFTSFTSPNGTNAACNVSSVASSERPPTYSTLLSCWGGMVPLVRRRRARVIDAAKSSLGAPVVCSGVGRAALWWLALGRWTLRLASAHCFSLRARCTGELSMGKDA